MGRMAKRISIWDMLVWAIAAEAYVESLGGRLDVDLASIRYDSATETASIDAKLSPPVVCDHIKVDITI